MNRNLLLLLINLGVTVLLIALLSVKLNDNTPPLAKILNSFSGFWANSYFKSESDIKNHVYSELTEKVEVLFDENLVPHIYASNLEDLFFAQGYTHASMRLWQMDMQARAASGRLSEVLGEITIETDKLTRRQGMPTSANQVLEKWLEDETGSRYLEAYSNGVNKYIHELKSKALPIEYKLLGFEPEEWSPYKSALMAKNMARTLCMRDFDIEMTNTRSLVQDSTMKMLFSQWESGNAPIIPVGTDYSYIEQPIQNADNTIPTEELYDEKPYENTPDGVGSNNWAVAPHLTKNGNAILCSDPHLGLTLPSIWYENHLVGEGINAYGVSLPGLPGVIIGFNENIAWGQTNVGQDILDWYSIEWVDEEIGTYIVDDKYLNTEIRIDTYYVKDQCVIYDTVHTTIFGPIVYQSENNKGKKGMAMSWAANMRPRGNDLMSMIDINLAKDYSEFVDALLEYDMPPQNFVYADIEGNIAMHVHGRIPLRTEEQGFYIQEGRSEKSLMNTFIPSEHNPKMLNPERGFVSSANQVSTGKDYPYPYVGQFSFFRGVYLNQRLENMKNITVDDMKKLQNDTKSLFPSYALKTILPILENAQLAPEERSVFEELRSWDFHFDKDLSQPVIFDLLWDKFYALIWDEFKGSEGKPLMKPTIASTIVHMSDFPNSRFFDVVETPEVENLSDLVLQAFRETVEEYTDKKEENASLHWNAYKPVNIEHLLKLPAFSTFDVSTGGHKEALNANSSPWGPSWRMVVELSKPIKAYGIYPGGQSGDPSSKFYDNRTEKWAAGEYNQLNFPAPMTDLGFEPVQIWSFQP